MLSQEVQNFLKKSFSSEKDFIQQAILSLPAKALETILHLSEERHLIELSLLSGIDDVFSLKARRRSLLLSEYLVDEKGGISQKKIKELIDLWKQEGRIIYANGDNDEYLYQHIARVLEKLVEKNFVRSLQKFSLPLSHPKAEEIIRHTLQLPDWTVLSEAHVTKALLSSLFHPLRQNVGSCFATAPAIIIQEEQKETFIDDLQQLVFRGKLQRVFQGDEYTVPWNPSISFPEFHKELFTEEGATPIWYSPSFVYTCQKADIFSSNLSLTDLQSKIVSFIKDKRVKTLDHLLEKMLLQKQRKAEVDEEVLKAKKQFKDFFSSFGSNPLLKTWEYTIASFCDAKTDFSEWNLYVSLGLAYDAPHGIGHAIYAYIEKQLQSYQKSLEQYQLDYEQAFDRVKLTESLLKQAYKENEIRRLKAEHTVAVYHLGSCLEQRDLCYDKGKWFTTLFNFIIKEYQTRFVYFFQEIYDPELQEEGGYEYDDSPAGFRLIYKYGRSDPSVWTKITSPKEYIEALTNFFVTNESLIQAICEEDFQKKSIEDITTSIVSLIRSDIFIESALTRIKISKIHPETIYKTPWSYISGGSMFSLLRTYFRQPRAVTLEQASLESPFDLAHFLLETMKSVAPNVSEDFEKNAYKRMLMHSPSHAFSFLPGHFLFKKGWQSNQFTYTWLRDEVLIPSEQFYEKIILSSSEQQYLLDLLCDRFPLQMAHYFRNAYESKTLQLVDFQNLLVETANQCLQPASLGRFQDELDRFFMTMLPLTEEKDLFTHLRHLLEDHIDENLEEVFGQVPSFGPFIDAKTLRELAKVCLALAQNKTALSFDIHGHIIEKARRYHLAPPEPLIFADTNWSFYYFAFAFSPLQRAIQIWRVNATGEEGVPMRVWNRTMNKTSPQVWAVCVAPHEYRL